MTITAPAPEAPAQRPALADPADRGRLDIHPSVLRKLAEHVADSVPGTAKVKRKVVGLGLGEHGASARISGDGAQAGIDVKLDLALHYPSAVRDTVDAVRAQLVSEVARVTGYRVRSVDVTVSALVPESRARVE